MRVRKLNHWIIDMSIKESDLTSGVRIVDGGGTVYTVGASTAIKRRTAYKVTRDRDGVSMDIGLDTIIETASLYKPKRKRRSKVAS